jgi:transposase
MARLVITGVVLEGRSKSEVARDYGVSRRWVQKLVARYAAEGAGGVRAAARAAPGPARSERRRSCWTRSGTRSEVGLVIGVS